MSQSNCFVLRPNNIAYTAGPRRRPESHQKLLPNQAFMRENIWPTPADSVFTGPA
jgi:hypothetical protein